jgi:hypothetical protein
VQKKKINTLWAYIDDNKSSNKKKFKQIEEALFKMEEVIGSMSTLSMNNKKEMIHTKKQIETLLYKTQSMPKTDGFSSSSEDFFKAYIEDAIEHESNKIKNDMKINVKKSLNECLAEQKEETPLVLVLSIALNVIIILFLVGKEMGLI